jgi:hypothetical protein
MRYPYEQVDNGMGPETRRKINDNFKDIESDIIETNQRVNSTDDRISSFEEQVAGFNDKVVHFDEVDAEMAEHSDLLEQLKASSIDGEVIAARNGFPSLLDFLKTLDKGSTIATKILSPTAGQTVIDLTDTGELQAAGKIIMFLIDGSPQFDSYTWTSPTKLTMKSPFAGTEKVVIRYFVGNAAIRTGHNRSHEKGGFDELDVFKLQNGDVIDRLQKINQNCVALMAYESLKIAVSGGYDWSPVFDKAIEEAEKIYGIVIAPMRTFDFYSPILFPPMTGFCGAGEHPTGTVLNYKGATTSEYVIRTSGIHQRNKLGGFRLELNTKANGILLGDFTATLPDGTIPVDFVLDTISVSGIGASYTGVTTVNASHYTFNKVRTGYGFSTGRGVWITADEYNSGVAVFTDCTFGRVDATSVGLEVSGSVNMDTFEFNGACYYGGKTPIKLGSNNGNFIRNIRLYGHAEARNIGQTVNVVELCNILGGEMILTYSGFSQPNVNAVSFKGSVERFNILGGEANAITGTIFKDDGATLIEDCMLQPPRLTNGSTAAIFSPSFSDKNFKFTTRRFITENINTKYLYNADGVNRISWGTQNPMLESTFQGNRGDYRYNTLPTELGTTGSKYIVNGWKCTSSGTGSNAVWLEDRGLTGN